MGPAWVFGLSFAGILPLRPAEWKRQGREDDSTWQSG